MADIKLLRLTTGEDVVAEVTNQEYADNVKTVPRIKKPFVLIPMAQNPGTSQESKLYSHLLFHSLRMKNLILKKKILLL